MFKVESSGQSPCESRDLPGFGHSMRKRNSHGNGLDTKPSEWEDARTYRRTVKIGKKKTHRKRQNTIFPRRTRVGPGVSGPKRQRISTFNPRSEFDQSTQNRLSPQNRIRSGDNTAVLLYLARLRTAQRIRHTIRFRVLFPMRTIIIRISAIIAIPIRRLHFRRWACARHGTAPETERVRTRCYMALL